MEKKLVLSDFVKDDRFELNTYVAYLFNEYYAKEQNQQEQKIGKQWIF